MKEPKKKTNRHFDSISPRKFYTIIKSNPLIKTLENIVPRIQKFGKAEKLYKWAPNELTEKLA